MLPFNIIILSENKTSLIVMLPPFFVMLEQSEISPTNSKINKQKKVKIHKTATFTKKKKTKIQLFYARICTSFTLDFKEIVCRYYNET